MNITNDDILNILKSFRHEQLADDLVTLNMISKIDIKDTTLSLELFLDSSDVTFRNSLREKLNEFLGARGIKVHALIFIDRQQQNSQTASSCGSGNTKNPFDDQQKIPGIKNIIAVASGKGGVGKSTVSTNLATSLAKAGHKVGLMDADIYGPSVDVMMGLQGEKPTTPDGKRINPLENHGVKMMSMGFLTTPEQAVIWRGSLLIKAIQQFLNDVAWGELDYLIIDLPPGTGDIQLTLTQTVPLTGSIVVTTPQDVALADVKRAVKMFEKVNVPVIGIIENMSFYTCNNCGHESHIFGKNGGEKMSATFGVPMLGQLPLDPTVVDSSDEGEPIVLRAPEGKHSAVFSDIAEIITQKFA
jgi:ATP-binding protein involved in chromosome partitioning